MPRDVLSRVEFLSVEHLRSVSESLRGLVGEEGPIDVDARGLVTRQVAFLQEQIDRIDLHLRSEALVAAISRRLLNVPLASLEVGFHEALAELGQSAGVQRAYIFLLSEDGEHLIGGYEWVAEGIEAHDFDAFRGVSVDAFPWSMEQFRRGETVIVTDPAALPGAADPERGACEMLSILSYVNAPLLLDQQVLGWLGFDAVDDARSWSDSEIKLIEIAADVITSAIHRKRREELVFRQRELSQRVTSMGVLAAGLAHEINNPLSFVVGNLGYVQELVHSAALEDAQLCAELRESLDQAREGAQRVHHIVADLRALSNGEETEIGDVDVVGIINATLRMASNQLRHRARVVRNYSGAPGVRANASQLGQVLLNLLLNAAKAIPEGRAPANEVEVKAYGEGDRVHIEVRDTGAGIPAEVLPRIFDPFYTTRQVGEGLGIGLAVCHSIVHSFGGSIDVTSEVDAGTTVTLSLPRAETQAPDNRRDRLRILLIDDEQLILDMLGRFLRDHDVGFARNGRAAVEKIDEAPELDVILCDVMMPDLCGIDVYNHVRDHHPGLEERIVFITGGALSRDIDRALRELPNPLLTKPFQPGQLRELVAAVAREPRRMGSRTGASPS